MIIVIPYSHERLELKRLPFATMAIMLLCIVVYFPASSRLDAEEKRLEEAEKHLDDYRENHKYLTLPEDILARMPADFRAVYEARQEWIKWNKESPEAVDEFLRDWVRTTGRGPSDMAGPLEDLAKDLKMMPGIQAHVARREAGEDFKLTAISTEAEAAFLLALRGKKTDALDEEQQRFDQLYAEYNSALGSSSLSRFAFIPSKPSPLGAIAHQFIHRDAFHLILNMLFLWLIAVKLEDIWSRPVFIAMFLFCGIAGALTQMTHDPKSTEPLFGASAAVSGLMGACLIRLSTTKIQFFYAYWFFSTSPKVGTFKAPAFILLTLWLAAQILSFAIYGADATAHWSQIGGFASGLFIALIFKLIQFEKVVLGVEPEVQAPPAKTRLVAFQGRQPRLQPEREARPRPEREARPRSPNKPAASSYPQPAQSGLELGQTGPSKDGAPDDGFLLPDIGDIDLPTDGPSEQESQDFRLSAIELPPIDGMETGAALAAMPFLKLPSEDQGNVEAAATDRRGVDLNKADTSMLDKMAAEAVRSEVAPESENHSQGDTAQDRQAEPTAAVEHGAPVDSLAPLPYLPTMAASQHVDGQDTTDGKTAEEHIALPAPVSLTGLGWKEISAKPVKTTVREVELKKIREAGLSVAMYGSGSLVIPAEEIRFIAIGRIEKVDPAAAEKFFTSGIAPKAPAMVLAAVKKKIVGKENDIILGYAMDEAKFKYDTLMRSTFSTRHRNFIALAKIMLRFYKNAEYLPCPGEVGENNLPIYADLNEFFEHIEKYAKQNS
jgi:membrane associated rhomboid family serine protease